ncbi:N-6 DNA methylase [Candidatus Bipolaricaulota bacterium]|nr:N-6 DNA methylase [Candidatus Bipolaricaulota bacterium]
MSEPKGVKRLVERFHDNRDAYRSSDYNEAQVRLELINPLFKALGWDVYNEAGYAEAYKEVIHEDAIKVGGATKAPDYAFRIGGTRKFFVEAKRPGVNLKEDGDAAYQLRRYAWSAKLPLSILIDFEEFAVYDCRVKPSKTDKASAARILYITYTEYAERWDEIATIFSQEAILTGSFDRYVESTKRKRGTAEVDDAFLKEIENWRDVLARNIALRNTDLSTRELNFAVQRTIDRIIFLRICEDRGVEDYGQLMALQSGNRVYPRLCQILRRADERYNSGLFHFRKEKDRPEPPDDLTLSLTVDDKVLKEVFKDLYYPDSPYEFSVLPADILGHIYEQFLGKVIRLTPGHHAKVEDKPEVKKAGGVYYTPTYIVDYIVEHTVGKLFEGKTPQKASKLRILDPACGSGSFLLGAYQTLLDWHLKWYSEKDPEKHAKGRSPKVYRGPGGDWRLTTAEKKRILLNNIYGVDIDPQAVEVTKLSLLLKVLEGENEETLVKHLRLFHERALPDLGENIKCGNSLIGPDFYEGKQLSLIDAEERYRINAFDWNAEFPEIMKNGGFDAVIGNPPWGAELDVNQRTYLMSRFPNIPSKTKDSYFLFITRSIQLLRKNGLLGIITPNTWLLINYAKAFRQALLEMGIREISDYGDRVFRKATVESAVLLLEKRSAPNESCKVRRLRNGKLILEHSVTKSNWLDDPFSRIILELDDAVFGVLQRLRSRGEPFERNCVIKWGIKPYQEGYGIPPQTRAMIEQRVYHASVKRGKEWKPLVVGSDVDRYRISWPGNRFIKYGKWLMYPSDQTLMERPKILMRQTSSTIRACLDEAGHFCQNSLFIVHSEQMDLRLLLGLLNSTLLGFAYRMGNPQTGKTFAEIKPSVIKQLPILTPNADRNASSSSWKNLRELVDSMLQAHQTLAAAKTDHAKSLIQRQIKETDKQIDQLVYELYGLTEEEIRIVEEATK